MSEPDDQGDAGASSSAGDSAGDASNGDVVDQPSGGSGDNVAVAPDVNSGDGGGGSYDGGGGGDSLDDVGASDTDSLGSNGDVDNATSGMGGDGVAGQSSGVLDGDDVAASVSDGAIDNKSPDAVSAGAASQNDGREGRSDDVGPFSSNQPISPEVGRDNVAGAGWSENLQSIIDKIGEFISSVNPWASSSSDNAQTGLSKSAETLASLADAAFKDNPEYCNKTTAQVAEAFGVKELSGKLANTQIDVMKDSWQTVSGERAQALANNGDLVIAGLKSNGHGHTAVVVPGDGAIKQGQFYPNVQGGGSPAGRSDGSLTSGDVWGRSVRGAVEYFTK